MIDEQYTIKFNFDAINEGANQLSSSIGSGSNVVTKYVPIESKRSAFNNNVIVNKLQMSEIMLDAKNRIIKRLVKQTVMEGSLINVLEKKLLISDGMYNNLSVDFNRLTIRFGMLEKEYMLLQKKYDWAVAALKSAQASASIPRPASRQGKVGVPIVTPQQNIVSSLNNMKDISRGKQ